MNELNGNLTTIEDASNLATQLKLKISKVVFGQEHLIEETLCCLLSGGHILMTGAPGLAKTTLVRVFSKYLSLPFGRVQFTPDLLPTDIIGSDILNMDPETGRRSFDFSKGPIFTSLLLADEINRASPRTQSALLEAMQEHQCTIGGQVHILPQPFMVFATQNPFESEGTFSLPEAQLDRFLIHSLVDYPDEVAEKQILMTHVDDLLAGENFSQAQKVEPLVDGDQVHQMIALTKKVRIAEEIVEAISELVRSSRPEAESCPSELRSGIWYGAGPRAGISLISVCRALALLEGLDVVRWSHVRKMAKPVLRHRIRMTALAIRDQLSEDVVIDKLLDRLESKHKNLAKGIY